MIGSTRSGRLRRPLTPLECEDEPHESRTPGRRDHIDPDPAYLPHLMKVRNIAAEPIAETVATRPPRETDRETRPDSGEQHWFWHGRMTCRFPTRSFDVWP